MVERKFAKIFSEGGAGGGGRSRGPRDYAFCVIRAREVTAGEGFEGGVADAEGYGDRRKQKTGPPGRRSR
jgi:hypothetical protein